MPWFAVYVFMDVCVVLQWSALKEGCVSESVPLKFRRELYYSLPADEESDDCALSVRYSSEIAPRPLIISTGNGESTA